MDTLESRKKGLKGLGYKVGAYKDGSPKLSKERIRKSKGRKPIKSIEDIKKRFNELFGN